MKVDPASDLTNANPSNGHFLDLEEKEVEYSLTLDLTFLCFSRGETTSVGHSEKTDRRCR